MHNLHLIVIDAENAEEAIKRVRGEIEDWGDENNYYSISGAVSEDNEVTVTNDEGYSPVDTGLTTIQKINERVKGWMTVSEEKDELFGNGYSQFMELVKQFKGIESIRPLANRDNGSKWHYAQRFCEFMCQLSRVENIDDFNVLENEFFSWRLDENGVTDIVGQYGDDKDTKKKIYIVFIDMHS